MFNGAIALLSTDTPGTAGAVFVGTAVETHDTSIMTGTHPLPSVEMTVNRGDAQGL